MPDFHKMTVTVLRSYFLKAEPKITMYRDYKKFSNNEFRSFINTNNGNLQNSNDISLSSFMYVCKEVLDKVSPLKQKYRANNGPFMNKDVTKAIMKRTKSRNNYLKHRCNVNRKAYNAQRSRWVSLVRKAKLDYYNKLNHKKVSDNKSFWKTVKPFFTDKGVNHDRILLVEENETISDNNEISEKLNNFFADIVKNLNIPQYEDHLVNTDNIDEPILRAKVKFKNHQSIQLIKCHYENKNNTFCFNKNNTFCFSNITHTEIEKELTNLDFSKSSSNSDIPTKSIQDNIDIFTPILHQ